MDSKDEDIIEKWVQVKDYDDEMKAIIACHLDSALDMARKTFSWNSDYESPLLTGEEDMKRTRFWEPLTLMIVKEKQKSIRGCF